MPLALTVFVICPSFEISCLGSGTEPCTSRGPSCEYIGAGVTAAGVGLVGLEMSAFTPDPTDLRATVTAGTAFSSMGLTSPFV